MLGLKDSILGYYRSIAIIIIRALESGGSHFIEEYKARPVRICRTTLLQQISRSMHRVKDDDVLL